jgi:hypothetical protein
MVLIIPTAGNSKLRHETLDQWKKRHLPEKFHDRAQARVRMRPPNPRPSIPCVGWSR